MVSQRAEPLSAIGKVVAVVEATAREHKLSRIAEAVQLPVSTVYRILQELDAHGWVRSDRDHGYRLDTRLVAMAAQVDRSDLLVRVALPILQNLVEATGHTVHMAVRQRDRLVYLAKLEGRSAYQMRSHVGLTIPMHSTACGKAFLAALPTDEVRSIVGRAGLPGRTERTIVDVNALLAHLELVRRQGFAVDDEENEAHVRCFGALAVDHAGTPVAAVSVSSLTFELDAARQRRHVALITEAASQISQQLGGPPPAVPS
ncbi:MAG: IclR family transcriptional regulator [Actinomycetota bacterium]|nr:IclR family transcriptional regulator [Actinomycetota bacterium]